MHRMRIYDMPNFITNHYISKGVRVSMMFMKDDNVIDIHIGSSLKTNVNNIIAINMLPELNREFQAHSLKSRRKRRNTMLHNDDILVYSPSLRLTCILNKTRVLGTINNCQFNIINFNDFLSFTSQNRRTATARLY